MPGYEVIGNEEREAVNEIFDSKSLFYNGKRVKQFEENFASYIGTDYAVAVSSGTAAIKAALIAAGVRPGDEVITQSFTFIATVEAILDVGAKPVIINIDETLNMNPIELRNAITNKTKAVIPVDMLGVSTEVDEINSICKENNIVTIDDNCEALGADWGNKKLGSQFDMCVFSFDNGKTITTGEGGMIVTNNEEYSKLCREYRDHGHENNPKYPRGRDTHRIFGFNFRTTEINAAIGIEQLKKLDHIVENNRKNYAIYKSELEKIDELTFRKIPKKNTPLCDCLIFSFPNPAQADAFVNLINEKGLGTKNVPDAIEWHFARYWDHIFDSEQIKEETEVSHEILSKCVAIPILSQMSKDDVVRNSETYRECASMALQNNN